MQDCNFKLLQTIRGVECFKLLVLKWPAFECLAGHDMCLAPVFQCVEDRTQGFALFG